MQSNRVTKPVEGREEADIGESSAAELERKAYHTPELEALGAMKQKTKGSNTLLGGDLLVLGGDSPS